MLDVLHTMFEDDTIPRFEQEVEVKSKIRTFIYRNFYEKDYKYQYSPGPQSSDRLMGDSLPPMDLPSDQREVLPYIPPTPVEDLPAILGPPVNG